MTKIKENNKAPFFFISKIESARRQLDVAIRLYFYDDDIVAIYTLVWAVYNLLSDLVKKQGGKSELDRDMSFIIPEKRNEMLKLARQAGNYFKHADSKDFNRPLKFYYKPLELYLFDSCRMYYTLTESNSALGGVYKSWFHLTHPGLLLPEIEKLLNENKEYLDKSNKINFFNEMLAASMKVKK